MASQDFVSTIVLTEQQIAAADQLEPSFEHLLRDSKVDNSTILALRHCQITDRDTFVGLDDSTEGLKALAKDMGIDLESGGMPHRREFARICTAWKKAKAQVEVKTSTEALQRQHGERITMLPEDWTSVIVQFKKEVRNRLTRRRVALTVLLRRFPREAFGGNASCGTSGSGDQFV